MKTRDALLNPVKNFSQIHLAVLEMHPEQTDKQTDSKLNIRHWGDKNTECFTSIQRLSS